LFTTCLVISRVVFMSQNSPCNIHKIKIGPHLRSITSSKQYMPYNELAWNAHKMLQITHNYSYIYNTSNVHSIYIFLN
jgi:hypothetical protein